MKKTTFVSAVVALGGIGTPALGLGLSITFDEFPSADGNFGFLTNEYAGIGVAWVTTDDGSIWGGNSNGDPGSWGLEGTNGPQFLGFNGASYSATMLFDTAATAFQLDVSQSNGSSPNDTFTLEGYMNGGLVDSKTISYFGINEWSTVGLAGIFDEVVILGNGGGFHPFGVDNITWREVPTPSSLALLCMGGLIAARRRR